MQRQSQFCQHDLKAAFLLPLELALAIALTLPPWTAAATVSYDQGIRPILVEHCLECHGPDASNRKAKLRLDVPPGVDSTIIVPGQPSDSILIERVTSTDDDERMPPPDAGSSLSPDQIETLRQWIQEGAAYETHWAFRPIRSPEPPPTNQHSLSNIDRFIVSSLESEGLSLSPTISRQQLIRRASFDLTGLPPTPEQVETFLYDPSPRAFEKVVDRLLESPRYGEHWGRHWLDIARYADTHGGAAIGFKKFPFSYTYRDYIVDAFNGDLPYNRFVSEQIAADQLDLPSNDPALAALGFLTVGQQFRNPDDTIDDQIDVVTRGLLGLTVTCARCHDHKYDAIPTTDYYALYATFAPSQSPEMLPIVGSPPSNQAYKQFQTELQKRQINFQDMARDQSAVMRGRLRMQVGLYLRELGKGTPEQDLNQAFLSYRTDDLRPHILEAWRQYLANLSKEDPVFGPWLQLVAASPQDIQQACSELLQKCREENGDLTKQKPLQSFASTAPRWNPRVLDALEQQSPKSIFEVADAYGDLFAAVHQEWLKALIETSSEAVPGQAPVPDENVKHVVVNSPINRQLRRHLFSMDSPLGMPDQEAIRFLNRPIKDNVSGRKGAIHNLHLNSPGSPPRSMALEEDPTPRAFHVMRRGNPLDRGPQVAPRFLTALSPLGAHPFRVGKRRHDLAKAITDPANPLARRVIVNWVWQHHFGQGLIRTPDDLGTRGESPTHPDLLDYLATALLEDDWSLKKLHRRIMLTAVYQQAALENPEARAIDPQNERLWRMPRRRLSMESMRDAMLFVSGELDASMGGRPFEMLASPIVPRRSIYAFVNRDIVSTFASTFDASNPTACTAKRPETNVPQQTLFALNSLFIQDRARALANRVNDIEPVDRIKSLYWLALSRLPASGELETALAFLQSASPPDTPDKWTQLAHALLASNEFIFVD